MKVFKMLLIFFLFSSSLVAESSNLETLTLDKESIEITEFSELISIENKEDFGECTVTLHFEIEIGVGWSIVSAGTTGAATYTASAPTCREATENIMDGVASIFE